MTLKWGRQSCSRGATVDGFEPYVQGKQKSPSPPNVGADANTAERLMFSKARSQAPWEAGGLQMIEDLADFTLFEELLEKMGKHLHWVVMLV